MSINLNRADAQNLVEFAKMDLGESSSMLAGCCAPAEKNKKWYPSFYVNKAEKLDLPLTGKATIEYRLRSQTKRQDDAGKVSHSADIEVLSIDPEVEEIKPVAGGKAVITKKDFGRIMPRAVRFGAKLNGSLRGRDAAALVEFARAGAKPVPRKGLLGPSGRAIATGVATGVAVPVILGGAALAMRTAHNRKNDPKEYRKDVTAWKTGKFIK